jgi:hypothetical protein
VFKKRENSDGDKLPSVENGCQRWKKARLELKSKTGKSVVTGENYLPQDSKKLIISAKNNKLIGIKK